MKILWTIILGSLLLIHLGCNNTMEGAQKDTEDNTRVARDQTADTNAAMTITPKIKSAIIANPILNEDGVKIDIDSTKDEVILRGYVKTTNQKDVAEELAQKILKDNKSSQKLKNMLEVRS